MRRKLGGCRKVILWESGVIISFFIVKNAKVNSYRIKTNLSFGQSIYGTRNKSKQHSNLNNVTLYNIPHSKLVI
jgi:hypothetical protein